jgi:hypothetical protein
VNNPRNLLVLVDIIFLSVWYRNPTYGGLPPLTFPIFERK